MGLSNQTILMISDLTNQPSPLPNKTGGDLSVKEIISQLLEGKTIVIADEYKNALVSDLLEVLNKLYQKKVIGKGELTCNRQPDGVWHLQLVPNS